MDDRVFVHDQGAVDRQIAGETVVVPVRNDVADLAFVYTLNATGTFLWRLMDGVRTVRDLSRLVVAEFEVTPEVASADVAQLIRELGDEGLLRSVAPASTG
jgi:Coenzyme PQQ synthesis protein D (PqqD)